MVSEARLQTLYRQVQEWYGSVFYGYGRFVAKHPIPFIAVPVTVFGLLGLGILCMEFESNVEYLYTPINSQASRDRAKVKELFPENSGSNFSPISLATEDRYGDVIISDENIFSEDTINEIRNLLKKIEDFNIGHPALDYSSLCARSNDTCVVSGSFAISDEFLKEIRNDSVTYPYWNGLDLASVISGVKTTKTTLKTAKVLRLTFHLQQDNKTMLDRAMSWENVFAENMLKENFNLSEVYFSTSQSLSKELNANTGSDVFWFSLSFTMLSTYAGFVSGGDCVGSMGHLSRAGVLSVGIGILGSFGFMALCGVKFVNIVGIMPFLILSIGVDDMFLMMSAWKETNKNGGEWDIPRRIGHTFRLAGVGITITSLTDLLAFAVGYTSVFRSIQNFCLYTGTAVIFSYIAHTTFFTGCLTLHGRRVEASRHCCTCQKVPPRDESRPCVLNCCCSGEPPRRRVDNIFMRIPQKLITDVVLTSAGKLISSLCLVALLILSLYGATRLEHGLILTDLVPSTSYYHSYINNMQSNFDVKLPIAFIMDEAAMDENSLNSFNDIVQEIGLTEDWSSGQSVCWVESYKHVPEYRNSSWNDYLTGLNRFLNNHLEFSNDVVFDERDQSIHSSRCYIISKHVPGSSSQANLMKMSRGAAGLQSVGMFAYNPMFIYFEQFEAILPTLIQTMGIAVAAMVCLTWLFLPHPVIVLLVLLNINLIFVGTIGFMAFWNLSLNSITMIHLIIGIGFAVDYTVHICSAYMSSDGMTRTERATSAVIHAAGPIFNGSISTLIGVITLVASQSYVFQSFLKITLLFVVFGLITSVMFTPIALSTFGPLGLARKQAEEQGEISLHQTCQLTNSHRNEVGRNTF